MTRENRVSPARCSVLIPYMELEQKLRRIDECSTVTQMMITELLKKVTEMDWYL